MWLKICKPLVTRYVQLILAKLFALRLFTPVFGMCVIINHQTAAMLRGLMTFVYIEQIRTIKTKFASFENNVGLKNEKKN